MSSSEKNEQPIKKKSLKSNFLFNFISQILILIIPLATSPYLARVLGVEVNGQISFATSIITYFTLASNFGFTTYGQREIARYQNDEEARSRTYWEIFTIRTIFTAVSLGVLFALIFANVFGERYKTFLLIQTITVFACCVDPSFYYQGMEEFKLIAIRTVAIKLIGLVLIFCFIKTKDDAWLYVLFNAGATLLSYIMMWPLIFKQTKRVKIKELKIWRHFKPALLIFLPNVAISVFTVLDKTMIGLIAENADYENGCYEKAYQLNSIMLLLIGIMSTVLAPRNARDYAVKDFQSIDNHIRLAFNYTWIVSFPLMTGCCLLCYSLSSWFLGQGYEEVPLLLQIMSVRFIASGISYIMGDLFFIPYGKEKYCTIVTTAGACLNFVLNIFFIKLWGAVGAAITTAITETFIAAFYLIFGFKDKLITVKLAFSGAPKKLIASLIMFVPVFFLNRYFEYSIWTFILIMLVGIVTYAFSLFVLRDEFFLKLLRKAFSIIKGFFDKHKKNDNCDLDN